MSKILKEFYAKLQNEHLDLLFDLEDDLISCLYKNGFFIFRDVSNEKANGLFVEYVMSYTNKQNEYEVLKGLNDINSLYNVRAFMNGAYISFSPIYVPLYIDDVDFSAVLSIFYQFHTYLLSHLIP